MPKGDAHKIKILFLDIDGVLNNIRTKETFEDYVFVSDEKILLLKQLVDKTDAKIVLSSSWRKGWRFKDQNSRCANEDVRLFEALKRKLSEYKIELMSYTKHFWQRGEEIDEWLKSWQGEEIESFVILDDMERHEFEPNSHRLVQTNISEGLTEKHVIMAIEMLNKK